MPHRRGYSAFHALKSPGRILAALNGLRGNLQAMEFSGVMHCNFSPQRESLSSNCFVSAKFAVYGGRCCPRLSSSEVRGQLRHCNFSPQREAYPREPSPQTAIPLPLPAHPLILPSTTTDHARLPIVVYPTSLFFNSPAPVLAFKPALRTAHHSRLPYSPLPSPRPALPIVPPTTHTALY